MGAASSASAAGGAAGGASTRTSTSVLPMASRTTIISSSRYEMSTERLKEAGEAPSGSVGSSKGRSEPLVEAEKQC